jgi:protein SCO1
MDPEGQFVEAFGQNVSAEEVETKINETVGQWQKDTGKKV